MNAKLKKFINGRNLALLVVAVLLVVFFVSCKGSNKDENRFRTEAVSRGSIEQTVSANGSLNPVTLVSVGTQVSGMVKDLYADYNDRVEQGQVLVRLDDSVLQATVLQSEANLAAARSSMALADTNLKRMHPLAKEGFVSAQEYDQAQQTWRDAKARVTQLEAQLTRDKTNLGYSVIRSPVSGVVVLRAVDAGQTVAASFNTPELFKIAADLKEMQIDAYFSEADVGQIRVGQKVKFRVDAFPNERFSGEVKQVRLNPKTESNVVTYDVVVSVANPDEKLLPGMTAYVDVTLAEKRNVIRVPNAALRFRPAEEENAEKNAAAGNKSSPGVTQTMTQGMTPNMGGRPGGMARQGGSGNGGGARGEGRGERSEGRDGASGKGKVYVLQGNTLKAVEVEVGIADRRYTEIKSGLEEGAEVVVEDLSLVQDKRQSKGFMMGM